MCVIEFEPETWPDVKPKPKPMEELEEIQIDDNLKHKTWVGTLMTLELKSELITFLRASKDVFV